MKAAAPAGAIPEHSSRSGLGNLPARISDSNLPVIMLHIVVEYSANLRDRVGLTALIDTLRVAARAAGRSR